MIEWLGLPPLASQHGSSVDNLIGYVHLLMGALFIGWFIYFVFVLIRFRRSRSPEANPQGARTHFPAYLEGSVALAEGALLVGLAIPIWAKAVDQFPKESEATVIRVAAQQFAWNGRYAGPDGQFGRQDLKFVTAESPMGVDPDDPAGKDDIVALNQLYVPVNKPVIIHLSSLDVIHNLSIKSMRVSQDAIPGLGIPLWFTPTKTGQFEINCAQLCGNSHYRMRGFLNVVTPEEYQSWVTQKSQAGSETISYE